MPTTPELLHTIAAADAFEAVAELRSIDPRWEPAPLTAAEAELLPRPVVALRHEDGRRGVLARLPGAEGPGYGVWAVSL